LFSVIAHVTALSVRGSGRLHDELRRRPARAAAAADRLGRVLAARERADAHDRRRRPGCAAEELLTGQSWAVFRMPHRPTGLNRLTK
jgi:hypothetical protein